MSGSVALPQLRSVLKSMRNGLGKMVQFPQGMAATTVGSLGQWWVGDHGRPRGAASPTTQGLCESQAGWQGNRPHEEPQWV